MSKVLDKSSFDGRLYTQAEYDAKHGTYVNKSTDTSGLGEYSDAELLKELLNRKVELPLIKDIKEILHMQEVVMLEHHGRIDCKNCSLAEIIEEAVDKRIKEIIGE